MLWNAATQATKGTDGSDTPFTQPVDDGTRVIKLRNDTRAVRLAAAIARYREGLLRPNGSIDGMEDPVTSCALDGVTHEPHPR